jgi:hypothetical protein
MNNAKGILELLQRLPRAPPRSRQLRAGALECAQAAGSDYIVSSDRDLLRLGQFAKVQIVKVAELLQAVQEQGR